MSGRLPIRLLIPDELPYSGGIERVAYELVRRWLKTIEKIIWVLPADRVESIPCSFPDSERLCVEPLYPSLSGRATSARGIREGLKSIVRRAPIMHRGARKAISRIVSNRLEELAVRHEATHCFTLYAQHQGVPELRIPVVGLIHDLNWRWFPENFPAGFLGELERGIAGWMEKADAIATPSKYTRDVLIENMPECEGKISTVPWSAESAKDAFFSVRRTNKTPTFYYPAGALAHKNHLTLFMATNLLAEERLTFRVILSGKGTDRLLGQSPFENTGVEKCRLFFEHNRTRLESRIEGYGYGSTETIGGFFRESLAIVLPSFFEGFGLPLIEGLSYGKLILASDIPAFREQVELYDCAKFVRFFRSDDPAQLASLMREAVLNPPEPVDRVAIDSLLERWTWNDVMSRYNELLLSIGT